jgi:hypothetical protein
MPPVCEKNWQAPTPLRSLGTWVSRHHIRTGATLKMSGFHRHRVLRNIGDSLGLLPEPEDDILPAAFRCQSGRSEWELFSQSIGKNT